MSVRNLLLGGAVLATVVSGGIGADVASAPEAKAACYGNVSIWQGTNNSCSSARHWDAIKNSSPKYGPWVAKARISKQAACWANVVSFGMTAK